MALATPNGDEKLHNGGAYVTRAEKGEKMNGSARGEKIEMVNIRLESGDIQKTDASKTEVEGKDGEETVENGEETVKTENVLIKENENGGFELGGNYILKVTRPSPEGVNDI